MSIANATPPVKPRTRKKPERFCKVVRAEVGTRTLSLRVGSKVELYNLLEIQADYGRGFEVTKPDGTVYHVCLDGLCSTCDCKGHSKHGHCKHVDSLTALEAASKL